MFELSFFKLIVVAVVALIVIGPEKLPKVARTAGLLFSRMQRYANSVKADISRELELEELRRLRKEVEQSAYQIEKKIKNELQSVEQNVQQSVESIEQQLNEAKALAGISSVPSHTTSQTGLLQSSTLDSNDMTQLDDGNRLDNNDVQQELPFSSVDQPSDKVAVSQAINSGDTIQIESNRPQQS